MGQSLVLTLLTEVGRQDFFPFLMRVCVEGVVVIFSRHYSEMRVPVVFCIPHNFVALISLHETSICIVFA